jgi:hypothetical protein
MVVVFKAYFLDDAFNLKSHHNTFEMDCGTMLCAQFHGLKIVHMVVVSHAYCSRLSI